MARFLQLLYPGSLDGTHPEMVDFGSEQDLSVFEAARIVTYVEHFKKRNVEN
jgi:hypothetical protein